MEQQRDEQDKFSCIKAALDRDKFRDWLIGRSEGDQPVGQSNSCYSCPIATYLTDHCRLDIRLNETGVYRKDAPEILVVHADNVHYATVESGGHIQRGSVEQEEWASAFIRRVDRLSYDDGGMGAHVSVKAAAALDVLDHPEKYQEVEW